MKDEEESAVIVGETFTENDKDGSNDHKDQGLFLPLFLTHTLSLHSPCCLANFPRLNPTSTSFQET